ncbi:MAG: hypothetical protein HYX65_02190 [Gemmatimonadetes bacterium]|nr:hypothetical protein [Gemmatimonadota bacterium]
MWADTLLAAEHAHLARLALWAMASLLTGTALLAGLRVRRRASPLLDHFALQVAAWGAIDLLLAWAARGSLALRDFGSARSLERFLWLSTGLDAGFVAVGVTLAAAGWMLGRRLGAVGAGVGIVVQGLALLVLDLHLATQLAALV